MSPIYIIENTFFANACYWGKLFSSLYNSGNIWAMSTGIASADLNMVWSEKPLKVAEKNVIADIKAYYRKACLPFWWWVFPCSQSAATIDILKSEDFSLVDNIPSLLADLQELPDEEPVDDQLQIIQVKNKQELLMWEDVSFTGFDFPPETRQQYHQLVSKYNLSPDSPQKYFLACINGVPVATALLFLYENAGGIYFVSTLAQHRKRGIGLTITRATMRFAKRAGARYATLQSSPDGLHVYLQAGFKEYCRVDVYQLL